MSERVRKPHEPKLAALHQLEAGRLSERGRRRVLRHLQRCDACGEALAGLRRFQQLAAVVPAVQPPQLDWSRIERRAMRVAPPSPRRRATGFAAAMLVVAAQVLIAQLTRVPSSPHVVRQHHEPTAQQPLEVDVTALIGEVFARLPDGRRVRLELDSRPQAGWTIETAPGGEAHLALADTARVLVRGDSALVLGSLLRDDVELEVARGSAVSKVQPLGERHYEVDANGYRATVRGTHFEVSARATGAAVRVDEGHVVVLSTNGVPVADLLAGQAWTSDPTPLPASDGRTSLPIARGLDPAAHASLTIPPLPSVVAWHVGDDTLSALAELRMRAPAGELALSAELGDGRLVQTHVAINPLGTRFDPALLRLPSPPHTGGTRALPPGELDTVAAALAIRKAQPALQRCYERSLRTSDLAGIVKLRLRLALDAGGKVRGSELSAAQELPEGLAACVRDAVAGLAFPAPGGSGVTFEAPLSFRTR